MKTPRPGQLCTINNVVYRARSRTNGCIGCAFNSLLLCPNIADSRNGHKKLSCFENNIILKRIGAP